MSADQLKALREALLMTQREFASAMGLPLRTYENLEGGRVEVRAIHLNAARWAFVKSKSIDGNGLIATPDDIATSIEQAAGNL